MRAETIVAIASPAGRGAIGVLRVSGPGVPQIAAALLGELPAPRMATLRSFRDADGSPLDQGVALYFPAPRSYTGEHVLELHGHGGVVSLDQLFARMLALGCRAAEPGEFSLRAFLNGKLDLAQAEAVADLIDAGSAAAARAAVRSLQGEFSVRIADLQSQLSELRVHVEAAIDFSDEDLEFLDDDASRARLGRLTAAFTALSAEAVLGVRLRDGLNVVIAGLPNAGKSSLMNRLVGADVAIVTALPGTTRDVLRHTIELDGLPVHLIDTAGLRTVDAAVDAAEAEGIRRARMEVRNADLVLCVRDGAQGDGASPLMTDATEELPLAGIPVTDVVNKVDLLGQAAREERVNGSMRFYVSARTGQGLELLRGHLKACAGYRDAGIGALSARRRHLDALERAHAAVKRAVVNLNETRAIELFAEELRVAQGALSEITGAVTSDELLGQIFGSFCIGK